MHQLKNIKYIRKFKDYEHGKISSGLEQKMTRMEISDPD